MNTYIGKHGYTITNLTSTIRKKSQNTTKRKAIPGL